jgi:hypothetical protein
MSGRIVAHVTVPRRQRRATFVLPSSRPTCPGYLDEFVFRFNRRTSRSRGLVLYRVLELAVDHERSATRPVKMQIAKSGIERSAPRNCPIAT